jgi:hypothetical protein
MKLAIAAQVFGVVTGFVSVYYWYRSATLKPLETPTAAAFAQGKSGDQVFEYEEGKSILYRYSEQSRLNANAAAWTGVTTFLQALALILAI